MQVSEQKKIIVFGDLQISGESGECHKASLIIS